MSSSRSRINSPSSRNVTIAAAVEEAEEDLVSPPVREEENEVRTVPKSRNVKTQSRTVSFEEVPLASEAGFRAEMSSEEKLQRIMSPAGLTPVEVIDTGSELFVKAYNTLSQKVYVKIPSNTGETDIASSMVNLARVEEAQDDGDEGTTIIEKLSSITKPLLDPKTEKIICGHGAESHEGFCVNDVEERTMFTVVSDQQSSYGHTACDAIPAPIVPLSAVINYPEEVRRETISQSMAIQRSSLQEARSHLSELVNTAVRTSRVASVVAQTFEQKINKIGLEVATLNRQDIAFESNPATPALISKRAAISEKLIHKNYAFNVLVGNAYALYSAVEDLQAAMDKINKVLEVTNAVGQHHSC